MSDSSRPPVEDPLIGAELGRFRVLSKLGAGGMGVVYLALDTSLKREVALKLLPDALARDPERLARFEREAEAVAALNHPNIVTIHSVEQLEGRRFLVMERVEGKTLDRLIPDGGMELDELLEIAIPLADAVAAAHRQHIVHRDLKPTNVMRTGSGLVKVLDFGLAKLDAAAGAIGGIQEEDATLVAGLTRAGTVTGTPFYMSPEQARGQAVDHRSDLFSLGILLYEMAIGSVPFGGETRADVLSAILRDEPVELTERRSDLPQRFASIVEDCLMKDRSQRCQTASEVSSRLIALRQELTIEQALDSQIGSKASKSAGRLGAAPRFLWAVAGLVLLVVLSVVLSRVFFSDGTRAAQRAAPATPTDRATLAVLPFENQASDPALDWLRSGLPEMLVTSLSQSRSLEVVTSSQTQEALAAIGWQEKDIATSDMLRSFARKAKARHLLWGSYVRLGESQRIDYRLEDVDLGTSLLVQKIEGVGEASLFSMVDHIGRAVNQSLSSPDSPTAEPTEGLEQSLVDATTSSIEAFRYYSEGVRLRNQIKRREAIAMFEQAIELDPGFSMAHSALGTAYLNLGDDQRGREYSRRAFEASARAPARERYFIRGRYLSLDWATYGQAIDAFQSTLDLYPDHRQARNILANRLASFDGFQRALPLAQRLVDDNPEYGGNVFLLATILASLDRFEEADRVVVGFADGHPDSWYGQLVRAFHFLRWSKVDEALEACDRAESLRAGMNEVLEARWAAAIQTGLWTDSLELAKRQAASGDPYYRWAGEVYGSRSELYRGRAAEALAALKRSTAAFEQPGAFTAMSHAWAADVLLLSGTATEALAEAENARRIGARQWPELLGLFYSGLAYEALGQRPNADAMLDELSKRANAYPNAVENRQVLHLEGLLALSRGETDRAIETLTRAAALLPPRGLAFVDQYRLPDHAAIWYSLASALEMAGRDADAASWYQLILDQRVESRNEPIRYARSHYRLGKIHLRLGETELARERFQQWAELWGDGDLDRREIGEVRALTGGP